MGLHESFNFAISSVFKLRSKVPRVSPQKRAAVPSGRAVR